MVDLISGGRLELGLGAGYRVPEFELFGTDFTARYQILDQQVARAAPPVGRGRPQSGHPGPVQDRLPVWLGYQGPKGARRAGRMGEGLLTLAASSWPHYRDGLAEGGHDPGRRPDGRRGAGVRDRRSRSGTGRASPRTSRTPRTVTAGTWSREPATRCPARWTPSGCAPTDRRPARCSTSCSARPRRSHKRSGEYAGDAPVQTVWLGASVAGLPEDLAARHVQTICTRLAPLLKEE